MNHSERTNRRWRIAVLLGVGILINYLDRVNLSVAHEALRDEFGISNETFGYLSSAYVWTYAVLQLPMGVLLDRFGVPTLGRISALLWSVASFASAGATGVGSFFATRLLLGIGEAPTFPASAKAVRAWFPRHERSLATSAFDGASKLASAIGVPLIGILIVHIGWRLSFAFTGLISFFFFLAFYFLYKDPENDPKLSHSERHYISKDHEDEPTQSGRSASLGYLLGQRKVLGLTLGFFAYNYCFYIFLTWLPSYFSGVFHIDLQHSALFTSVPWFVAAFMDFVIGGWLVDTLIRRGHRETLVRQTVLVGGTALGLAIIGVIFSHDLVTAVFWISVSLGGLSAAAPVGWSVPGLIAPRNSVGKVGGILNTGNQIAGIIAPTATGYLAGPTNAHFGRAFAAAAIILVIGICAYIFLLGKIEQLPEPVNTV
ncbi:MAG: MFS transporter [Acidobacteriaceae bacterium]|nr:MFS transporter [Acidobacteriaceae bacterium]MBV9306079.1 MFS transporter [Acidobacteriaceae bacterium]MBV9679149.1 MFS transporter [Acidobacteriaceae bacterium]